MTSIDKIKAAKEIAEEILGAFEVPSKYTALYYEQQKLFTLARAYFVLEKEITNLNKSREVLRKACEFYGDKIIGHAPNGKIEMLEHGEIAIKALKADNEIMEGK